MKKIVLLLFLFTINNLLLPIRAQNNVTGNFNNLKETEGKYNYDLWKILKRRIKRKEEKDTTAQVRLTFLNPHKIQLELLKDNNTLATKVYKCRLKGEAVYITKYVYPIGLAPILFFICGKKIILSQSVEGNLRAQIIETTTSVFLGRRADTYTDINKTENISILEKIK